MQRMLSSSTDHVYLGSVTSTDSGLGFFDQQNCDSEFHISPRISQQRKMSKYSVFLPDKTI